MTDGLPQAVRRAAADRDAFEVTEDGVAVETTVFDGIVTASATAPATDGEELAFVVRVTVPMLSAAASDEVSDVVVEDWFETLERRAAEAGKATRKPVEFTSVAVQQTGDSATVEYRYRSADAASGLAIAKTLVEYVEGTYLEGIVPGYDYTGPVADLLATASQSGEGGTPL